MKIREVRCKSILSRSGISDYAVNCYTGCGHGCRYCYARFMMKFKEYGEAWGEFADVKINAAEALCKEVKKKRPGNVFMSSVCDGWQPLEAGYRLSRDCLKLLLENGFTVDILTKSALIERDFDILKSHRDKVELGLTLTTADEKLRRLLEPGASPTADRISALGRAADLGINTYAFLGPFMPYLTDREADLEKLFRAIRDIKLGHIYLDRLNLHHGVWESLHSVLKNHYPYLDTKYRMILFNRKYSQSYSCDLARRAGKAAGKSGLGGKLKICFK